MKAARLLAGIAACALLTALAVALLRPSTPDKPVFQPQPAPPHEKAVRKYHRSAGSLSDPSGGSRTTLALIGMVQAGEQATLSTSLPAKIVAVTVREGDSVQRGQLLVGLDDRTVQAQERTTEASVLAAQAQLHKARLGREAERVKADADVQSAEAGLQQAQAKAAQATLAQEAARDDTRADLAAAREGVRKAQAALDHAQQDLHSLEELAQVGGASRSDLDGARLQVQTAQSDLDAANAQVRRLTAGPKSAAGDPPYRVALAQQDAAAAQAGVRQAREALQTVQEARRQRLALADQDVRAAEASLSQARAGVQGAQAADSATHLASPISGIVTQIGARAGETAQPGVPLVTIVSLAGLRVEALAPARQLALLHVRQAARIRVDTLPDRELSAVVSEIAPTAEPDGRSFRVRFRFLNAVTSLRPGQTARIQVFTHP
ncbi:MAG TPA: efflux RND transporter periplasmic adaptor subunit [Chthonomonadaceae bacterium]|nr:efflux RND transporter periplasmic adaptor subunit [Chthonomonadaceae bacterium]